MRTLFLLLIIGISLSGISQEKQNSIKLLKQKHLTNLPSASAVEYINGEIFIIGDDSPFLYKLDSNFSIVDKTLITGNDSTHNGRVPKPIKSDFESMTSFSKGNNTFLIILSSGSQKVTRDTIHLFSLNKNKVTLSKNIRPLFDKIKTKAGFSEDDEINFEALAVNSSSIFMLQRGNNNENMIVSFNKKDFLKYLKKGNAKIPDFHINSFRLPELQNTIAGFSGACVLSNNSGLLFTASLEASLNAYDDGEILGSYIGIIKFDDFKKGLSETQLVMANGKVLKTKLEGITIKTVTDNKITIIAVSDNDDGTSWIFEMEYFMGD